MEREDRPSINECERPVAGSLGTYSLSINTSVKRCNLIYSKIRVYGLVVEKPEQFLIFSELRTRVRTSTSRRHPPYGQPASVLCLRSDLPLPPNQ